MLDAAVALGRRVLLPVTVGEAPLDWASFGGRADLVPGPHGLLEPGGARVGPGAIGEAAVVVVPALAATAAGVRLGRGGGHYDRSLPLASPSTVLVALVGDDELVGDLPVEAHDVRVHAVWRPTTGSAAAPKRRELPEHRDARPRWHSSGVSAKYTPPAESPRG